jgi:hypothetical protein
MATNINRVVVRVQLAAQLPGTRYLERRLKRWHKTGQFCPVCRARRGASAVTSAAAEPRRRYAVRRGSSERACGDVRVVQLAARALRGELLAVVAAQKLRDAGERVLGSGVKLRVHTLAAQNEGPSLGEAGRGLCLLGDLVQAPRAVGHLGQLSQAPGAGAHGVRAGRRACC